MAEDRKKQEYLSALAFLHCEIQGRRETARFDEKENGEITVLFDTSLVIASLRPHIDGPEHSQDNSEPGNATGGGLGQLLPRLPAAYVRQILLSDNSIPTLVQLRRLENVLAWHTAHALIEKVFQISRDGNTERKIYQFPSHLEETNNIFNIVDKKYHQQIKHSKTSTANKEESAAERSFRRATGALAAHQWEETGNLEYVAETIMSRAEIGLLELFKGASTLTREYEAISKIRNDGAPVRFDTSKFLEGAISDKEFSKKFLTVEKHAVSVLHYFFEQRIKAQKSHLTSTQATDVEALVELARNNKRLLEKDKKHRLIFVTSDKNLVLASYAITEHQIRTEVRRYCRRQIVDGELHRGSFAKLVSKLEAYFGLPAEKTKVNDRYNKLGKRWFQNFAGNYVRHLWAVVEDALIEKESDSQKNKAVKADIFNGLYAKAGERIKLSRRRTEDLFSSESFLHDTAVKKFNVLSTYLHWNKLTRERIKTQRMVSLGLDKWSESEPSIEAATSLFPREVFEVLDEYSNRNRDRAMVNISDHGAHDLITVLASKKFRGRPVDLNFLTLKNTNGIFEKVASKTHYQSNPGSFISDFTAINRDCYGHDKPDDQVFDDRQRSHLKLLVLASIFAAQEKWAAAQDHVRRAIDIVERSDGNKGDYNGPIPKREDKDSNMSGREARYLYCICRRMLAENMDDFANALASLDMSRSALEQDCHNNEKLDRRYHRLRFANEEWSLSIARYYLARSKAAKKDFFTWSSYKRHTKRMFDFVTAKDEGSLDELAAFVDINLRNLRRKKKPDKASLTVDAIALNFVQVNMIGQFWRKYCPDDYTFSNEVFLQNSAQSSLAWLSERATRDEYIESPLVALYRKGLPTVAGVFDGEKFENIDEFNKACTFVESKKTIRDSRVEYDIWRINNLLDFIRPHIKLT